MRVGALALGLAGLFHSWAAQAEQYQFSRVRLLSTGCAIDGLGDSELRAAAASELSASSLALVAAADPPAASEVVVRVRLPCGPALDLGLSANFSGITFERVVTLDELPPASRARAVALLLAELLAEFASPELAEEEVPAAPAANGPAPLGATPHESRAAPQKKPTAPRPVSTGAAHHTEIDHQPALNDAASEVRGEPSRFGVGGELRAFFGGSSLLGGRAHGDWGKLAVGVSVLGQNSSVSGGEISAFLVQGTCAVGLLTLGHPQRTSLSVGPRVGLGYVTVTATPLAANLEARAAGEPYFDGAAFADLGFHPLRSVRFGVAAELGYARGVVALFNTTDIGHYGGGFASAVLDVTFEL